MLGTRDTWRVAGTVYAKLFRYMKPYRWRFYLGAGLEILAGMFAGVMMLVMRFMVISSVMNDSTDYAPA